MMTRSINEIRRRCLMSLLAVMVVLLLLLSSGYPSAGATTTTTGEQAAPATTTIKVPVDVINQVINLLAKVLRSCNPYGKKAGEVVNNHGVVVDPIIDASLWSVLGFSFTNISSLGNALIEAKEAAVAAAEAQHGSTTSSSGSTSTTKVPVPTATLLDVNCLLLAVLQERYSNMPLCFQEESSDPRILNIQARLTNIILEAKVGGGAGGNAGCTQ